MARYLIGIDLGTTHCVVAYMDTTRSEPETVVFPVEQLVAPGEVAPRPLLPSMRYHPASGELAEADRQLSWQPEATTEDMPDVILGELARELGAKVPGRLVTSAKSWLSHGAVDRTAPILPWGAPPDIPRVSPLAASASYLSYLRRAWHHRFPEDPMEEQHLVLTIPASFDEAARNLTVEAARTAGLSRIQLVEEPQAACYDWLTLHDQALADVLRDVRLLLVCDVGGGTTDFTLIQVEAGAKNRPRLRRIGVGDHLMLGGDNMDLALAHLAEGRLMASGQRLGAAQLTQLVQQCRAAKERLLADDAPETATVTVLGAGAQLVGGARSTELSREEIQQLVVDGFLPRTDPEHRPQRRRAGIVEFGLPYASDPAVTRHLAAFLADHAQAARAALGDRAPTDDSLPVPDAVLLNGGVFQSASLCQRLLDTLGDWRGERPRELHNAHPDLAVARGAVAYGRARQGQGLRIGGGSARSFVLLVEGEAESAQRAICLLPRGTEEGQEIRLADREFALRLGQPVRFHLMATGGDLTFRPGELVEVDMDRFRPLPPMATVLAQRGGSVGKGREVPVQVAAKLTEVGTLEIDCVATEQAPPDLRRRWRLEFQLRGRTADEAETDSAELHPAFPQAAARIHRLFGPRASGVRPKDVKQLQPALEKILGRRDQWDTHLLREIFASLWDGVRRRRRTADHERVWFNLAGYCLRPGYGYPLDDWRVQQLWSLYEPGVQYVNDPRNWAAWWNLWRRISGGLDVHRQLELLGAVQEHLQPRQRKKGARAPKVAGQDDMVRLLAGLERLSAERKAEVGGWLLGITRKPTELPQRWWALGRLGTRVPFYGSAHDVVPADLAREWLDVVLSLDWRAVNPAAFSAAQLARLSGDRGRDLDDETRRRVAERLRKEKAPAGWVRLVEEVVELDSADQTRAFGESLPPGLRLVS